MIVELMDVRISVGMFTFPHILLVYARTVWCRTRKFGIMTSMGIMGVGNEKSFYSKTYCIHSNLRFAIHAQTLRRRAVRFGDVQWAVLVIKSIASPSQWSPAKGGSPLRSAGSSLVVRRLKTNGTVQCVWRHISMSHTPASGYRPFVYPPPPNENNFYI